MKSSILDLISRYIGCDKNTAVSMSQKASILYKRYLIPKRKGGVREIYHPSKLTKALQYAIMHTILKNMKIHKSAVAYIKGLKSPLLHNAKLHAPFRFSIRVDFRDFFPSIKPIDLFSCLENEISIPEKTFLTNALFMKKHGNPMLVIGAPSSPMISNIVMYSIDEAICNFTKKNSSNVYTRYADDVIFSTNTKGECLSFLEELKKIIDQTDSPNLTINEDKTLFLSRANRRLLVGLVICPDGKISIGLSNKQRVRKLLYKHNKVGLSPQEKSFLRGYLAFIADVEPAFLNRLSMKYTAESVSIYFKRME